MPSYEQKLKKPGKFSDKTMKNSRTNKAWRRSLKKPSVTVDMINVGWGDCFLIHLIEAKDSKKYRILIDGGTKGQNALTEIRSLCSYAKNNGKIPIELMIASHYVGDHLQGLTTIVDSSEFLIKEAWLPPVIDDTRSPETENEPRWLAKRLLDSGKKDEIIRYLKEYGEQNGELGFIENFLKNALESIAKKEIALPSGLNEEKEKNEVKPFKQALVTLKELGDKKNQENLRKVKQLIDIVLKYRPHQFGLTHEEVEWYEQNLFRDGFNLIQTFLYPVPFIYHRVDFESRTQRVFAAIFLSIVKSRANGAITAIHLDKLVKALNNAKVPMRTPVSENFNNVTWGMQAKGWVEINNKTKPDLHIVHMSPSRQLILRLIAKIPRIYLSFLSSPSVSASNQLSHVINIHFHTYSIIMTGDSDFNDFPTSTPASIKEQELMEEIANAQIVKVPHHGGSYGDFGLSLAQTAGKKSRLRYLLVTNGATAYRTGPRPEFSDLIKYLRNHQQKGPTILFSNPPQAGNFRLCPNCPRSGNDGPTYIRIEGKAGRWTTATNNVCCSA